MPDDVTATTEDLKAQFTEARLAGDHARLEAIGRQLYPEGAEDHTLGENLSWGEKLAAKVAAAYHAKAQEDRMSHVGTGKPSIPAEGFGGRKDGAPPHVTRAALEARIAELRHGPTLEPAHRGGARLEELESLYKAREALPANPQRALAADDLVAVLATKDVWTDQDRETLRAEGVVGIEWPAPPEGTEWSAALDHIAAQLVGRGIEPAVIERWVARGLALRDQEPATGMTPPLDENLVLDAKFALEAFLPDRTMRAEVEKFLDETGLGNDVEFIRELAVMGRPLRQLLGKARRAIDALKGVNEGSPAHKALTEARLAAYRRVYGGV